MKRCSLCREEKDLGRFSPTKKNQDGSVKYYNSQCTECRTDSKRKTPKFKQNECTKECRNCRVDKVHEDFSPSIRGTLGLSAYCKPCTSERFKSSPDAARKATADYRARHPERSKAAHRLHQYKRREKISATSDGTVTDEFLKELYSRIKCYWCEMFVHEDDRTLEHVVELNDGGSHSIHNIEMACKSCNSARLGRKRD